MRVFLIAAALSAVLAVPAAAGLGQAQGKARGHTPTVVELPQNFNPEGIATAARHTFFVGSRVTGAIYPEDFAAIGASNPPVRGLCCIRTVRDAARIMCPPWPRNGQ